MKRAKLLSLFLAGSLLFQTAGINAMASAPSEISPINETVEDTGNGLSEQPVEETEASEQPAEEETDKDPAAEESHPDLPSENEEGEDAVEEDNPDLPFEDEETQNPAETDNPDQPSADEENRDPSEGETPDLPSDEETPGKDPSAGEEEDSESLSENNLPKDTVSENTVSENTVSENTISENTIPEENKINIFSIFPGLGDSYHFSAQELEDKQLLASHVGDVVDISSPETATLADFQDTSDKYQPGEVVYLAETPEEAEQVAAAFGGTLQSYSYEVAVIDLPEQATVALAVTAAAMPEIKLPAVWPNYYNYLYTETDATLNPKVPSDPGYKEQWFHDYIGTRYAWAAGYKGQGIKVAVIDTGLTRNHEDLAANAIDGRTFVNNANGTTQNTDNGKHGTHVAGIIAADDNGKGAVGIAPDAKVRGYSVFTSNGTCQTSWIIRAVNAAVQDGNHIINMSLGSPQYDGNYQKAINKACKKGVAIFAASGNDDSSARNYPAAYSGTISIGAVDKNGTRASFSCYGSSVTLSFPGVGIYSTVPGGYESMDGTSMACPAAAGTAAVILSARADIRKKTGKARVDALLSAMKSSTTKCSNSGMGAGTTYLPGVLKIATEKTAPEKPIITVVNEASYKRGTNKKDYIAQSIKVTLTAKTAVGVDIYYSTDGKTPTYKNGAISNAANTTPYKIGDQITLTGAKKKTIKAIAVNPFTGKVSKAASKTVTLTPLPTGVTVTPAGNVTKVVAGKQLKFTATVAPAYAISNKVKWTVVDAGNQDAKAKGVTIASNGTVKTTAAGAKKTPAGTYKVIATAVGSADKKFEGGKTGSFTFNVIASSDIKKIAFTDPVTKKAPKAQSIKTTDSKTTDPANPVVIDLGTYLTVTKTGTADALTGKAALAEVVWSSSNTKVATVSSKGVITAVAPGKATIKATANDGGGKNASYKVTVVQPVTGITISGPKKVAAGKGISLTAKVTPANAGNKKVMWSVNGDGNMKINKGSGKITTTANASGTYTVTAKSADGLIASASATCQITIVSGEITKIKLNANKLTLFPPKTSAAASATTAVLAPTIESKGTADHSLITWTSSAPSIASVNAGGKITAKAPGKATITCAAIDGSNKKATCVVTVAVPMSKLVIGTADGNDGDIAIGKKVKMAAKYYSNYGTPTNKAVSWEIAGYGNQTLKGKVKISSNGTVSVDKKLTLPSSNAYVTVRAAAKDGSGVKSNTYRLTIKKTYVKARIVFSNNNGFIIQASTKKNPSYKDWEWVPDYCTATISGSSKSGMQKQRGTKANDPNVYAVYAPIPGKRSTNSAFKYSRVPWSIVSKECEKMTLTIKLKDGSNLTAQKTIYAVIYVDSSKKEHIIYFS